MTEVEAFARDAFANPRPCFLCASAYAVCALVVEVVLVLVLVVALVLVLVLILVLVLVLGACGNMLSKTLREQSQVICSALLRLQHLYLPRAAGAPHLTHIPHSTR